MAPPSSPDRFPSDEAFASSLITVEVGTGDNHRTFKMHKDILCFYSGYFSATLSGRFAEADEGVCRLTKENPVIFEMFANYVYKKTLYEPTLEPAELLTYEQLAKLWIFADAHDIPMLQNEAIDALVHKASLTDMLLTRSCARYILDNTVDACELRRLLEDILQCVLPYMNLTLKRVRDNSERTLQALPDTECKVKGLRWRTYQVLLPRRRCWYHVHEKGVSCKGV